MTNTTLNVPRELLERAVRIPTKASVEENHAAIVDRGRAQSELRALLSAPSPAGVDADHVEDVRAMVADPSPAGVDWLGNTAKLLLPALRQYMHNDGSGLLAGYDLETTQAIIDGLRGENEALQAQVKVLQSDANSWQSGYDEGRRMGGKHCALTIDQQAQRIAELASHLEFAVTLLTVAGLAGNAQVEAMRAALSAGHEPKQCT